MTKLLRQALTGFLLAGASLFWLATPSYAGTDLTVTCADEGPCTISPASTPLYYEENLAPGVTRTQTLTITNDDNNDTCLLDVTAPNHYQGEHKFDLESVMFAAISDGTTTYYGGLNGGAADGTKTYADLFSEHTSAGLTLGALNPGASRSYTWYATFDPTAGDDYQNTLVGFDLQVAVSCSGGGSVAGASTSSGTSGGDGGDASPQVCTDSVPSSAPVLSLGPVGPNTVSLSWTPVSPVSHYAIVFTRSDGEAYGSSNIGNTTQYTVSNLSGGYTYTFEVFGVNGCAPGDRSNQVSTSSLTGPPIDTRPTGPSGEVLGQATNEETSPEGTVEGVTDLGETCAAWQFYLPWMLLAGQIVLILLNEFYFKEDRGLTKHFITIGVTILSMAVFYWLKSCGCYTGSQLLAWLCDWYFIVAIITGLVARGLSFTFIEEIPS